MQIDYIRRDTPEEISEEGGAFIQIVNKDTLGLNTSIDEAKSALYVVGANSMIEGYFVGLMRSIFEGIKEDGHPRTIGDITIYPVCGGTFDLDKGWDPLVNDVRIKARLGSGITLDITNWTFRDVTEGRVSYSIDTVSDGETAGIVSTNSAVELNGRNFPAKSLLSISWACGEKSGTVDAAKFTANVARITIDKSAFSSLASTDDGKEIVFTVKGCYNKATKSAVVKYVEPVPAITKVVDTDHLDSETDYIGEQIKTLKLFGENLGEGTTLVVNFKNPASGEWETDFSSVTELTETSISITLQKTAVEMPTGCLKFTVTNARGTASREVDTTP